MRHAGDDLWRIGNLWSSLLSGGTRLQLPRDEHSRHGYETRQLRRLLLFPKPEEKLRGPQTSGGRKVLR